MIFFTVILIILILYVRRYNDVFVKFKEYAKGPYPYYLLIGLLVLGFLTRYDFTERFGDIIGEESIFDIDNLLFSTISIGLILVALVSKKGGVKIGAVSIEFIFCMIKLFYFKGGYIVGIGAIAHPFITLYDMCSLVLRLLIIRQLIFSRLSFKSIIILTYGVIGIKVFKYPLPYNFYVEEQVFLEQAKVTLEKLQGSWIGICESASVFEGGTTQINKPKRVVIDSNAFVLESYDSIFPGGSIHLVDSIRMVLNSDSVRFYGINELDKVGLRLELYSKYSGELMINSNWQYQTTVSIDNTLDDSLEITLHNYLKTYKLRLSRVMD